MIPQSFADGEEAAAVVLILLPCTTHCQVLRRERKQNCDPGACTRVGSLDTRATNSHVVWDIHLGCSVNQEPCYHGVLSLQSFDAYRSGASSSYNCCESLM